MAKADTSGGRHRAEWVKLRIYPVRRGADFSHRLHRLLQPRIRKIKGTNVTLQRRDAIKSLLSFGLTVVASADAQGKTVEISMTDSAFVPPTITISTGDAVTWINPAVLLHTVTFDPAEVADKSNIQLPAGVQPFGSGDLSEQGTFTHLFAEKGIYAYVCKYHESMGMKGTVVVS